MPLYSHPAEIRDNGRRSCKSGHTDYREMSFRLDESIPHCSDNTITTKMSSANASSIKTVDNPKGKASAWNYFGFVKSEEKVDKATFSYFVCL